FQGAAGLGGGVGGGPVSWGLTWVEGVMDEGAAADQEREGGGDDPDGGQLLFEGSAPPQRFAALQQHEIGKQIPSGCITLARVVLAGLEQDLVHFEELILAPGIFDARRELG